MFCWHTYFLLTDNTETSEDQTDVTTVRRFSHKYWMTDCILLELQQKKLLLLQSKKTLGTHTGTKWKNSCTLWKGMWADFLQCGSQFTLKYYFWTVSQELHFFTYVPGALVYILARSTNSWRHHVSLPHSSAQRLEMSPLGKAPLCWRSVLSVPYLSFENVNK